MAKPELTVLEGGRSSGSSKSKRAMTLLQAVASDDQVAEAKALRALLAKRIADPKTSAVAIAALTKQFRELGEVVPAPSAEEGRSTGVSAPDEEWDPDDI